MITLTLQRHLMIKQGNSQKVLNEWMLVMSLLALQNPYKVYSTITIL